MSSTPPNMPPNMPPGGGAPSPYPPYDSKAQWRVYREQQKAAWRAQREAWKAQRHAIKANYVGIYGPRVPSFVGPILLIGIGVIALMLVTGHIAADEFWAWYGHWWPLLLIGAGLLLMGEWMLDLRREIPVRRSGGFVGLLILLAILGFAAAGWNHARPWFNNGGVNFGLNDDFFNTFGLPEHDFDAQVLNTQIPANANVEIQNPRGSEPRRGRPIKTALALLSLHARAPRFGQIRRALRPARAGAHPRSRRRRHAVWGLRSAPKRRPWEMCEAANDGLMGRRPLCRGGGEKLRSFRRGS